MKCTLGKTIVSLVFLSIVSITLVSAQNSAWVSDKTIASVVRLGKIYDIFLVQGMPDAFKVTVEYGVPNFGGGTVAKRDKRFMDLGSGVIISADGWIVTNSHVSDDWTDAATIIQDYTDNKGNKYKYVLIPATPGYMWVTVAKEGDITSKKRKVELLYVAQTMYYDTDYNNYDRDRSIAKIVGKAKLNTATGLPEVVSNDLTGEVFPFSQLGSPFDLPIQDAYVTAMGFPGSGPQTFTSITKGEFIGYERNDRAYLMHGAFISGGNSGGGLFYSDKLIGINTWDKSDPHGRHLSIAQPITYFGESFAYVSLWYGVKNLPEVSADWIASDPSTDLYKNKVYVGFNLVSMVNEKVALKGGYLVAYRKDVKKADAYNYIDFARYLQNYSTIHYLVQTGYEITAIAAFLGLEFSETQTIANMTDQELLASLNPTQTQYLDIFNKGQFFANFWTIDEYGQVLAGVPSSNDFNVTVISNGFKETDFKFTSTNKVIQGPFKLKVAPQ